MNLLKRWSNDFGKGSIEIVHDSMFFNRKREYTRDHVGEIRVLSTKSLRNFEKMSEDYLGKGWVPVLMCVPSSNGGNYRLLVREPDGIVAEFEVIR